jgi:hypothetical protein
MTYLFENSLGRRDEEFAAEKLDDLYQATGFYGE